MSSKHSTDPFKARDEARRQILFSLLGVWATSLIFHMVFNAKCWESPEESSDSLRRFQWYFTVRIAMLDIALWGLSMYLLFERMYGLLKDNVIITCYVSGIGSRCGLGYLAFVREGQMSLRG
jgi:hypothetical protein